MLESTATTTVASPVQATAQVQSTSAARSAAFENARLWLNTPLTVVGSNSAPLTAYPCGRDLATSSMVKKQLFTSFSLLSCSQLARYYFAATNTSRTAAQQTQTDAGAFAVTAPSQAVLAATDAATLNGYLSGNLIYTTAAGFLTEKQLARKLQRLGMSIRIDNVAEIQTHRVNQPDQTESAEPSGSSTPAQPVRPPVTVEADYLPFRLVNTSHLADAQELDNVPYSESFASIDATLSSDQQGTAIRATLKSATTRDSTSWSVFVNGLKNDSGSCTDTAPLIRWALTSYSISQATAPFDTAPLKALRNLDVTFAETKIKQGSAHRRDMQIIAMTQEMFTSYMALNQFPSNLASPFLQSEVDRTWTAVPIKDEFLSSPCVAEYVNGFFPSDTTFGRVSKKYNVRGGGVEAGTCHCIPTSNLAYLGGPKNVIVVLTDRTSASASESVRIGSLNVPVFTGRPPVNPNNPFEPADWGTYWSNYFTAQNIPRISHNIMLAWNYFVSHQAVGPTVGHALSRAAELIASTPPGLYVNPQMRKVKYDVEYPLCGAHVLETEGNDPTAPLAAGSPYLANRINLYADDSQSRIKNIITGINLAGLSPLHIPPSGITKVAYIQHEDCVCTVGRRPDVGTAIQTYSVKSASSVKRVAISLGLISKTSSKYILSTAEGVSGWLHMLTHAMAANTSTMLQKEDMPVRDWSGYNNDWADESRYAEISEMKDSLASGFIHHAELVDAMEGWEGYDEDWFRTAYGGIDPFSSRCWYQQSFVPSHFHIQWLEKLGIEKCPEKGATDANQILSVYLERKMAMPLSMERKAIVEWIMCSFNTAEYHPIMVDRTPRDDSAHPMLGSWIEQTQYQSLTTSGARNADRRYTQTLAHTESLQIVYSHSTKNRELYVTQTDYTGADWSICKPKVSSILWPDPPESNIASQVSKNCRVKPRVQQVGNPTEPTPDIQPKREQPTLKTEATPPHVPSAADSTST
ncbi:MAG: hypothetical protein FuToV10_gp1 [Hangzhou totivirus 10]|nr:MAG: hypothetical protein FuToV10_gp1 [Hangzhou totivirus 10]